MTDTNTNPSDEGTAKEREVIEELRSMDISIVGEEPQHVMGYGSLVRYLIIGRRGTQDTDPTIEALGDSRLNALRALKVQALAS